MYCCDRPMRVIPAGISKKTGKPYNAFYSCEICKRTQNGVVQQQGFPTPNTPQIGAQYVTVEQWNELIQKFGMWKIEIEKRLGGIETIITDMTNKDAVDLHQSTHPVDEIKVEETEEGVIVSDVPF